MAYLDRMHQAKGQKPKSISYNDLKKKYDKLSSAVSAHQEFLDSIPKSERKKKKSSYLRSRSDIDRYFLS